MNNLSCSVLLISVILILVDADCSTYPNVTDANFEKDCDGNVIISCNKDFKMVQGLECVEEEWRYQNPICKRTEIVNPCKNNGTVLSDGSCNCTEYFGGTFCEEMRCEMLEYQDCKSECKRGQDEMNEYCDDGLFCCYYG
ncbi:hypothetical protein LOTGIDRAFT_236238 [Lottia gigantea]|uniref:EGF-like domain-containing protein n=1 Tax=Lottia gigantea TaxID=225164 RepID=V3ZQ18_LOTGI|nr:hypothetical protein LOTGIDRAFT_236238 [Lottia gigantea]ESO84600.1 hypothetical protein LOTGIDRAFT_236238 [Lottia gigantea]